MMKRIISKYGVHSTLILWILLSFTALFAVTDPGTDINNIAYATYQDPGGYEYSTQSDQVTTTVSSTYILSISKDVERSEYIKSDTVRYHIELENSGNISASSVTVTDTLENGLTFLSSQPTATVSGQYISWNLQNIQPGASTSIELQCLPAPGVLSGTTIENKASYKTPEDSTATSQLAEITILASPVLTIENTVDLQSAYPGDTLKYTVTVGNTGDAPATNTALDYYFSSQLSPIPAFEVGLGVDHAPIGTLIPGATLSKTFAGVIKNNVIPGEVLSGMAIVTCDEGVSASDDAQTIVLEKLTEPELWIERTSIPFANPGDTLSYRIKFGNSGDDTAHAVILTDSLDANLEFGSATGSALYDGSSHLISWNLNEIPEGQEDSVEIRVIVKRSIPDGTQLSGSAKISSAETAAVTVSSLTTILAPQLFFIKTSDSSSVEAGEEINYRISYLNTGNGEATNVIITDSLSSHVTYVSSSQAARYDAEHHVVTWEINDLEANMSLEGFVDLIVRTLMPLDNGSVIVNMASIDCYEGFSERSTVNTDVISTPLLQLNKSVQTGAYRGDTLTYTLSFTNQGNGIALFTRITDTLPSEVEFLSAEGVLNYDSDHHCLNWDIGDLMPGVDSSLFVKAKVLDVPMDVSDISNVAWIHSQDINVMSNIVMTSLNALNVNITAAPDTILGNGITRTLINVSVKDNSGEPAPDGTPVRLRTTHGTFSLEEDTLISVNGLIQTELISSVINREYLPVKVTATVLDASKASDSTMVTFSALRITGIVRDNDGTLIEGAIVTVLIDGVVVGIDTTGADGIYSIAVYTNGLYTIRIRYLNNSGDYNTIEKGLEINIIDPDQNNTIEDLCSISGNLIDYNTQKAIYVPNIPIIIDIADQEGLGKRAERANGVLPDTTYTDSTGFWTFRNLLPRKYTIETIYTEGNEYHQGSNSIDIGKAGENIINIDIIQRPVVFKIYKTVDKAKTFSGDTLNYTIVYETTDNEVSDTIRIIDQLPNELELLPASLQYSNDIFSYEYNDISKELILYRAGMPQTFKDSIKFMAIASNGTSGTIVNEAVIMSRPDTAYTVNDPRTNAETVIMSHFLTMTKTVNWPVAEMGDILTYTLKLENKSQGRPLYGTMITDILPQGFRYKENRSVLDGEIISDPDIDIYGHNQTLLWTLNDTLQPGSSIKLKYRVIVGLESHIGENLNIASAELHLTDGFKVFSNTASAEIVIKPSMIQDRGLIFGKIFYDLNGNDIQDRGEGNLKGVEIITEEGIRIITDDYGKYSIPNVRLGDHVLRVNTKTLPENTKIRLSSSDFLGDTGSRLVKVTYSGIAKANFAIEYTGNGLVKHSEAIKAQKNKLEIRQRSLTSSMRMIVNDPWSVMLQYEYSHIKGTFVLKNASEIDKAIRFLKEQKDLQVEIREHYDFPDNTIDHKKRHPGLLSPGEMLLIQLKQSGIKSDRIYLSEPDSTNKDLYQKMSKSMVELILMVKKSESEQSQELKMEHQIKYTGSLPLKSSAIIITLPTGFKLDEHSAILDALHVKADKLKDGRIKWDLGKWNQAANRKLNYTLIPEAPSGILTVSSVSSMMVLKPTAGKNLTTDVLTTNIPTRVEKVRFDVTLEGALFDVGSYKLKPEALASIDQVGEFMLWQDNVFILVEGFTDSTGTISKNKQLSLERANAVKNYLIQTYSISKDMIETKGNGEDFPIADNGSQEGRAMNRRIEIILNNDFTQKVDHRETVLLDEINMRVEKRNLKKITER